MSTSNIMLGSTGSTLISQRIDGVGYGVTMSGNGNYVAALEFLPSQGVQAIYIYIRTGALFVLQQIIPVLTSYIAIDLDDTGQRFVVGNPNGSTIGTQRGVAAVYVRSGSTWSLEQAITLSGLADYAQSGFSVSISGDSNYIALGAPGHTGVHGGAVYVYLRSGSVWNLQQTISVPAVVFDAGVGYSVSLNSDATYIAIGAPFDDNFRVGTGKVFVWIRSGSVWVQQASIKEADGLNPSYANNNMGTSVSINSLGDTFITGIPFFVQGNATGSYHMYTRGGSSSWVATNGSNPPKTVTGGSPGDQFGNSVALSDVGNKAVVGSPFYNSSVGGAYIILDNGVNPLTQTLYTPVSGSSGDRFGWSVDISNDGQSWVIGAGSYTTLSFFYVYFMS